MHKFEKMKDKGGMIFSCPVVSNIEMGKFEK